MGLIGGLLALVVAGPNGLSEAASEAVGRAYEEDVFWLMDALFERILPPAFLIAGEHVLLNVV